MVYIRKDYSQMFCRLFYFHIHIFLNLLQALAETDEIIRNPIPFFTLSYSREYSLATQIRSKNTFEYRSFIFSSQFLYEHYIFSKVLGAKDRSWIKDGNIFDMSCER